MKAFLLSLTLVPAVALPAFAQQVAPAQKVTPVRKAAAAPKAAPAPKLLTAKADSAAKVDGLALGIVRDLTTEVGPRMPGTEAEARGRTWAVARLKKLGFKNVRIETFDMPVWVRGEERAEVVAPYPQKLVLTALGNSGATPDTGITAPVVGFNTLDDLRAAAPETVFEKIVFVDHAMTRTQDGSSYGYYGAVRRLGPSIASKLGAAAIVIRSVGTDVSRSPHTGVQSWADGATPIPAAALSVSDAQNLARMLATAKAPVTMRLVLTPRQTGIQQSGNVIAEVPGRDPKAGIVLIGGHLDSWDLGTGAMDDGAGLAITTAAAKALMNGKRPRRTVRLVWFGAEEVGLFGGLDYLKRHGSEAHALAAEADFGGDRVWRLDLNLPRSATALGDRLAAALAPLGVARSAIVSQGTSDIGPLVATGVSAISLQQDGTRYFDLHHTPEDTFDKIDPVQLEQAVSAWTVMLRHVADAPEDLVKTAANP